MGMDITINGVKIKQPKNPSLSSYNLTKSGRTASGLMTMDLVAKKKKLFLDYEILAGKDLQQIIGLIDSDEMFFNVNYRDTQGSSSSFVGYVGELARTLHRGDYLGGWYWTDVSFNIIEQ